LFSRRPEGNRFQDDLVEWHIGQEELDIVLSTKSSTSLHGKWNPDGLQIAFRETVNGIDYLKVHNTVTGQTGTVGTFSNKLTLHEFAWMQDGRGLLVTLDYRAESVEFEVRNREVYLLDVASRKQFNLSQHPDCDDQPAISPDGQLLTFISNRTGNWDLYLANSDGSDQRNVTETEDLGESSPIWSFDSKRIAFTSARRDPTAEDIYIYSLDDNQIENVTDSNSADFSPVWSPNGRYIAFHSWRGHHTIDVIDLESNERMTLLTLP
jgi:TolB protein